MNTHDNFMDVFDAAAFLGVHDQTLRKLARRREIPGFKVGRDWRFRKEALIRWADQQSEPGGNSAVCSVLIIDDEQKVGAALSRALGRLGCRTRIATSGARGIELVFEAVPDLVLLDLQMPDMNGPQFLSELRKEHLLLPVVIVTGYPEGDLMRQAMEHPPVMLLAKPVDPELLERTVRGVVGEKLAEARAGGAR